MRLAFRFVFSMAVVVFAVLVLCMGCAAPSAATVQAAERLEQSAAHLEQLRARSDVSVEELDAAIAQLSSAQLELAAAQGGDLAESVALLEQPGVLRELLVSSGVGALVWIMRDRTRKRALQTLPAGQP